MEFNLTEWWVPAIAMMVLGLYIARSFITEYRLPMPETPVATRSLSSAAAGAAEHNAGEESGSEESGGKKSKPKKKRSILWRTSWLWGPLLIGAAAQLYLTHVAGIGG